MISDMSCGLPATFYGNDAVQLFGGMHVFMTDVPTSGDTANSPDRGELLATRFINNYYETIADSYLYVLNDLGSEGLPCTTVGDDRWGGGGGYNGCGCNLAVSVNSTAAGASNELGYNWIGGQEDSLDAVGNQYFEGVWQCNYDSNSYKWNNP